MIEVYTFLAAFAVLIPAVSVLIPYGYLKSVRAWTRRVPVERFAELGIDFGREQARYLKRYRTHNVVLAVLGILLLAWLSSYMGEPGWNRNLVNMVVTGYYVLFLPPMLVVYRFQARHYKLLANAFPERKRRATLQPRALFDFVSPVGVFIAIAGYFLFAAFVLYLRQHPFPGFGGLTNLVIITPLYGFIAFQIYAKLYGKRSPLETHEEHAQSMGVIINLYVYVPTAILIALSVNFALAMLDLRQWEPFTQATGYVLYSLVLFKVMSRSPRNPDANGFGSHEPLANGTRDLAA